MIDQAYLRDFIDRAIREDIGPGDHSSNCSIPTRAKGQMLLKAKAEGIWAGAEVGKAVFERLEAATEVILLARDGDSVTTGQILMRVTGPVRSLLQGERLALNLMQRMSGIATKTRHLVNLIEGTTARLLDTRKTTPNLRPVEKAAVRLGGGYNHRMGLYDMIMLKDNHVDFAGGIAAAVSKARKYLQEHKLDIPIEVEVRNFEELRELLACQGVQRVMFDNFNVADTADAVQMVNGQLETESSGNIDEQTIRAYAETGVNFISVGALTHSYQSLDMSFKAQK